MVGNNYVIELSPEVAGGSVSDFYGRVVRWAYHDPLKRSGQVGCVFSAAVVGPSTGLRTNGLEGWGWLGRSLTGLRANGLGVAGVGIVVGKDFRETLNNSGGL